MVGAGVPPDLTRSRRALSLIAAATASAKDSADRLVGLSVGSARYRFRGEDEGDDKMAGDFGKLDDPRPVFRLSCNMCRKVARCEGDGSGGVS